MRAARALVWLVACAAAAQLVRLVLSTRLTPLPSAAPLPPSPDTTIAPSLPLPLENASLKRAQPLSVASPSLLGSTSRTRPSGQPMWPRVPISSNSGSFHPSPATADSQSPLRSVHPASALTIFHTIVKPIHTPPHHPIHPSIHHPPSEQEFPKHPSLQSADSSRPSSRPLQQPAHSLDRAATLRLPQDVPCIELADIRAAHERCSAQAALPQALRVRCHRSRERACRKHAAAEHTFRCLVPSRDGNATDEGGGVTESSGGSVASPPLRPLTGRGRRSASGQLVETRLRDRRSIGVSWDLVVFGMAVHQATEVDSLLQERASIPNAWYLSQSAEDTGSVAFHNAVMSNAPRRLRQTHG